MQHPIPQPENPSTAPHSDAMPQVRLMPRANVQAIHHGFPWVYASDLVMDRRTRSLTPGTMAVLLDTENRELGVVTVNPLSKIAARMIDRDPGAVIDEAWFVARLRRALNLRTRMFADPFYRLVHAEADGMPGVVIDRFGDVAVVQPNAAWSEMLIEPLVAALVAVTGVTCVIKNGTGRSRKLEGLDSENAVLHGTTPDGPVHVRMNGAIYMADVVGGQKTGLFYDQRPNHAFIAGLAAESRLLDVFSHVGGFGLAALAGGAQSATMVDGSAPALALVEQGAQAMNMADRVTVRRGDAFVTLAALAEEGASFQVVICDPPAFAPSAKARDAGLRAYERVAKLAAPLVVPGGILMLCSCSHAADLASFRAACVRGISKAGRHGSIIYTGFAGPDHPVQPQLAESGYLKALAFHL